ncbi:hypothetical protein C9J20_14700 [Photobacterium phosphoreum]|uniref:hypothetical protein n=1 Tax=Photobacterium phosphoreum TaxID=659 RepID=UPI000D165DC7|nr:hypothetical protein [Photobacterium phosphoreum]PSU69173.1 hypothetical protein CTM79_11690 [Photobacterium phosphoreum]PSW10179.1 hypothetical protein C9J20_14700 [Photobacterium phosphoreum]
MSLSVDILGVIHATPCNLQILTSHPKIKQYAASSCHVEFVITQMLVKNIIVELDNHQLTCTHTAYTGHYLMA